MTKRRQIPKKNRELILNRDGGKCFYCGSTERLTVDHIIPLKHGGSNLASNMITSCHSCNSTKNGNRLLPRFENAALNKAMLGNADFGIPQEKDMSYTKTVAGNRREQKQKTKTTRWKRSEKDLDIEYRVKSIFDAYNPIYFSETKGKTESDRFIYRAKKRGAKYLSIPSNEFGGRAFLSNEQDNLVPSVIASRMDTLKIFIALMHCGYRGNMGGSCISPKRIKKVRPW